MRVTLAQNSILNLRTGTNIYILHVKRIYSEKEDFLKYMREVQLWFLKRSYPENIDDQELGKSEFSEPS